MDSFGFLYVEGFVCPFSLFRMVAKMCCANGQMQPVYKMYCVMYNVCSLSVIVYWPEYIGVYVHVLVY